MVTATRTPGAVDNAVDRTPPSSSDAQKRPPVVKLSFNVAQHQVDTLERIANARNLSKTEVLRHAIALEAFIHDELAAGSRVIIENAKGEKKEVVLF